MKILNTQYTVHLTQSLDSFDFVSSVHQTNLAKSFSSVGKLNDLKGHSVLWHIPNIILTGKSRQAPVKMRNSWEIFNPMRKFLEKIQIATQDKTMGRGLPLVSASEHPASVLTDLLDSVLKIR